MAEEKQNKPVERFAAGSVSASVFVNTHEDKKWYSVVLQRVYNAAKEGKPADLKNTNNFNELDLPHVSYVTKKAYEYILENRLNKEKK